MLNEKWTLVETVKTVTGLMFSRARGRFARFVKRLSAVISVGLLLSGCEGPSSSPTSPTPPGAAPQAATYTMSGVVYSDTAEATAIEGVRIEWGDLRVYIGGLPVLATTGPDGRYSASGFVGRISLRLIKFGYEIAEKSISVDADTRVDFLLVRKPTFVLSGRIFEVTSAGAIPVEDVQVYCDSCGDGGHSWVKTDSEGRYAFPAVYNGSTPLFVGKDGYVAITATAAVNGDTRFDIEVTRR